MGALQPWNSLTVASEKDELESVVHGSCLLALAWILKAGHLELWVFSDLPALCFADTIFSAKVLARFFFFIFRIPRTPFLRKKKKKKGQSPLDWWEIKAYKDLRSLHGFIQEICTWVLHWKCITVSTMTWCKMQFNLERSMRSIFLQVNLWIATRVYKGFCKAELLDLGRPEQ